MSKTIAEIVDEGHAEELRDVFAEGRTTRDEAKIRRLRLKAMNESRTTEERAAANAEANRISNILRGRR